MPLSEQLKASFRRPRRMAREMMPQDRLVSAVALPAIAGRNTKIRTVLDLLRRPEGCSLEKLVEVTGWRPHTTRAALTGLRKRGHAIASIKPDAGSRIYLIVVGEDVP